VDLRVLGGQYLLTTTIEEKSNRVIEVLLSAVSPLQLMVGKILGQMAVGIVMLVAYAGVGIAGLVLASLTHLIDPINLVYLAVYFLIAFFLIATMMASIGSAVNDLREAQALLGPVMIVLIIPMMLWLPILRNPNSVFAQVVSFVPPISPFVMVLRLSGSEPIPFWQVPATIIAGVIYAMIAAWGAAKIFRIGVLMYGKPPNLATLIKWVRMA
jgi:ABC-2 type transport system permease protein